MNKEFIVNYYFTKGANPLVVNRYLFSDDEIIYVKAQCSSDRRGFYKEFWNGCLLDEKNYGDCSCYFKMNELLVYPENF